MTSFGLGYGSQESESDPICPDPIEKFKGLITDFHEDTTETSRTVQEQFTISVNIFFYSYGRYGGLHGYRYWWTILDKAIKPWPGPNPPPILLVAGPFKKGLFLRLPLMYHIFPFLHLEKGRRRRLFDKAHWLCVHRQLLQDACREACYTQFH